MAIWAMTLLVLAAGGVGGVVASILSEDRGFIKPTKVAAASGTVYRPGWIGLIVTGGISAWLSWGLYGSVSSVPVTGGASNYTLTMGAICGAVLVGAGGSKWLSSQVDKTLLQQAAAAAAVAVPAAPEQAQAIATGSPAEVLGTAKSLAGAGDGGGSAGAPISSTATR
jgi:hypothetical protein